MDSFRLTRKHDRFVAQHMSKALSSEALQSRLDIHRRIENDMLCIHCLRQASGSEQSIAPLGLATRLDADRRALEQPQRYVKERRRIATLELKLDLADRLGATAIGRANFTLVDRGLDPRGRAWFDFNDRTRD
jgi:hypothetical protein